MFLKVSGDKGGDYLIALLDISWIACGDADGAKAIVILRDGTEIKTGDTMFTVENHIRIATKDYRHYAQEVR